MLSWEWTGHWLTLKQLLAKFNFRVLQKMDSQKRSWSFNIATSTTPFISFHCCGESQIKQTWRARPSSSISRDLSAKMEPPLLVTVLAALSAVAQAAANSAIFAQFANRERGSVFASGLATKQLAYFVYCFQLLRLKKSSDIPFPLQ